MPSPFKAHWPAPPTIHTLITTRYLGHSHPPYAQNNLAAHVGDLPQHVEANRAHLQKTYALPNEPHWLNQTHSTICIIPEKTLSREADAAVTTQPHQCLAVLTADCLPILMCHKNATAIAAIHAGWRGLMGGIIENTLSQLALPSDSLLAYLGPSLCVRCFEVGEEVLAAFQTHYPFSVSYFKKTSRPGKWLLDYPALAAAILKSHGIHAIYQSNRCTYEEKESFFSYRRDTQTGRIASLIWME